MAVHHGKHHAKYVANTVDLLKGRDIEKSDLVTIIRRSFDENQSLFNNAAQCFNHEFYWENLKPNGGGLPSARLNSLLEKSFGNFANFRKEFTDAGLSAFGSGWAW